MAWWQSSCNAMYFAFADIITVLRISSFQQCVELKISFKVNVTESDKNDSSLSRGQHCINNSHYANKCIFVIFTIHLLKFKFNLKEKAQNQPNNTMTRCLQRNRTDYSCIGWIHTPHYNIFLPKSIFIPTKQPVSVFLSRQTQTEAGDCHIMAPSAIFHLKVTTAA